jgi:hypothetical protein
MRVHFPQRGGVPVQLTHLKMQSPQVTEHVSPQVSVHGLMIFEQRGASEQHPKTHVQEPHVIVHSSLQREYVNKFNGVAKVIVKIFNSKRKLNSFILISFFFCREFSLNLCYHNQNA